jgi:hypothetical protein
MTPGQIALEAFIGQLSPGGFFLDAMPTAWSQASTEMRKAFEAAAEAVTKAAQVAPPKEVMPKLYVDAILRQDVVMSWSENNATQSIELTLPVVVPIVSLTRGSNGPVLKDLIDAVSRPGGVLRLVATSDEQARSEFARINPDGSVREMSEVEGTW